jgi:hypothetical protein
MSMLIQLLIVLIVIGALLYLLQRLPLDAMIKNIIYVVVVVAVCIYLLKLAGAITL